MKPCCVASRRGQTARLSEQVRRCRMGGYLRDAGLVDTPYRFRIRQGVAMGRPSLLTVEVPVVGGILVTGSATVIPDSAGNPLHKDTRNHERTRTA